MDQTTMGLLEQELERFKLREPIVEDLVAKGVHPITAMIIAGDQISAQENEERVKAGTMSVREALGVTGSYARLDLALRLIQEKYWTEEALLDDLPAYWVGSDPDDTDDRYLALWKKAWVRNGRKYVRDGRPLPRRRWLAVYRGQKEGDKIGIAWSLDPKIAQKFAKTLGGRHTVEGGVVLKAVVLRDVVLAYLTERGESEVIVDPVFLRPPTSVKGG